MKKLLSCLLVIVNLLILVSCNKNVTVNVKPLIEPVYSDKLSSCDYETRRTQLGINAVSKDTVQAINQFSFSTSERVLPEAKANCCYSPLSLYYALALATCGAAGTTDAELLKLLGSENNSDLAKQCANLYLLLNTNIQVSKLKIANSLWLNDEIDGQKVNFKNSFLKSAADDFYASVYSVDFDNNNTGKAMSEWISKNTNGTITPKLKVDHGKIMSILNTIYFYDEWIDRFNEYDTKSDKFYLENGNKISCKFMNMANSSHAFYKGNGYLRSSLELKGKGSMVFILPDKNISISSLLASKEKIEEIFTKGASTNGEVVWSVPKFEYHSSLAFKDMLCDLGVKAAFSKDADFSDITGNKALISDVLQETHISIDENGVEAGAFTKIDYFGDPLSTGKAEMILNRPFIYGIIAPNGTLLFIGVCRNPTSR